jgi:hypothetical protein
MLTNINAMLGHVKVPGVFTTCRFRMQQSCNGSVNLNFGLLEAAKSLQIDS